MKKVLCVLFVMAMMIGMIGTAMAWHADFSDIEPPEDGYTVWVQYMYWLYEPIYEDYFYEEFIIFANEEGKPELMYSRMFDRNGELVDEIGPIHVYADWLDVYSPSGTIMNTNRIVIESEDEDHQDWEVWVR